MSFSISFRTHSWFFLIRASVSLSYIVGVSSSLIALLWRPFFSIHDHVGSSRV